MTDIILCHFRPFFALLPHYWPWKLKFRKNVKITWRYYPFTHVHHNSRSYDVWFLNYKVQRTTFVCHFGPFFVLWLPKRPRKSTFLSLYYHFTLVYHKWQSYDVWFLRYQAWQTEFFVILGYFLPVYPLTIQKIKILKYYLKYYHFTHEHHKSKSYDLWFLRYGAWQTESFLISDHFLPFCPPLTLTTQRIKILKKWKKTFEIIIILHKCTRSDNHMIYGS